MNNSPPITKKEIWAWAMYDFANSGYTTVVLTAVFNAYFVSVVAQKAVWATLLWTVILAVSYALVMVLGPIMGAAADQRGNKKSWLALNTVGCIAGTLGLALVGRGNIALAAVCIIVSNTCYALGENLTAAFLPELSTPDTIAKISGWGWSFGYFGGLLALGLGLAAIHLMKAKGATAEQFIPVTMLITAGIYAIACIPTFLYLRERPGRGGEAQPSLAALMASLRDLKNFPDLSRFFVCGVAYQCGLAVVISLAAVYAEQALGFTQTQTLLVLLVVNVTAAIGAFLMGRAQDKLGHKRTLQLVLTLWFVTIFIAIFWRSIEGFWVTANLAGFGLGAAQSGGRALVGSLSPYARRAEMYGLWGMAVRFAAIIGPISYGLITLVTDGNHRMGLAVTWLFFGLGLWFLRSVNIERGQALVSKQA